LLKPIIRIFAPRTRLQFVWSFVIWATAFELVFLLALTVFGLRTVAPYWQLLIIGLISVTPFLSLTLLMLKYQIGLQRKMRLTARTDSLTRLPNRRAFVEAVEAEIETRGGMMLMVDVDHFKRINDTYGHGFGDYCLQRTALMMRPVIPRGYFLARLGGEEFGIMLFDGTLEQSEHIGNRVARGTDVEAPVIGELITVTNSVGATIVHPGENLSDVLNRADHALYEAKSSGRARYVLSAQDRELADMTVSQRLAS